jgi:methyltransferase (TIGR00027 family)
MRKRKASRTAQFVAFNRALGNLAPSVPGFSDPMAEQLLPSDWKRKIEKAQKKLPSSPYPFWLRGMGVFNQFRTVVLDQAILSAFPIEQLVILGAGFDGRAWRLKGLERTIVFEVDHPDTQALKRERTKLYAPLAHEVRFVTVDFTRDNLAKRLSDSGFNIKAKTFWLWEGVTMYLSPEAVSNTLSAIAACSSIGSSIAFTYMAKKNGKPPRSLFLTLIGEPPRSAFTLPEIAETVSSTGWNVIADTGIEDWKRDRAPNLDLTERKVRMQWYERILVAERKK